VAGAEVRSSGSTVPVAPAAVHVFRQDVAVVPHADAAPLGVEPLFRLPPGSILSGVLLTGLDAPTALAARRDPMPALLRVKQDTILPNLHSADQRECFVLVSGYGDLSAERAYLRAEDLSCVLADGSTFHERIEGYVVGEDGRAGMNGKVVSRQGAFIARSLVTGIMEGIAQAFGRQQSYGIGVSQGQLSFQQAGDQTTGGAISGAAKGLDRIADFYLQQAVAMFPVVEILAGRKVDLVLTNEVRAKLPTGTGE
jgi:conjugal transfer pilus assembly protein TraB